MAASNDPGREPGGEWSAVQLRKDADALREKKRWIFGSILGVVGTLVTILAYQAQLASNTIAAIEKDRARLNEIRLESKTKYQLATLGGLWARIRPWSTISLMRTAHNLPDTGKEKTSKSSSDSTIFDQKMRNAFEADVNADPQNNFDIIEFNGTAKQLGLNIDSKEAIRVSEKSEWRWVNGEQPFDVRSLAKIVYGKFGKQGEMCFLGGYLLSDAKTLTAMSIFNYGMGIERETLIPEIEKANDNILHLLSANLRPIYLELNMDYSLPEEFKGMSDLLLASKIRNAHERFLQELLEPVSAKNP